MPESIFAPFDENTDALGVGCRDSIGELPKILAEGGREMPRSRCGLAECAESPSLVSRRRGSIIAPSTSDRRFVSATRMDAESSPKHLHVRAREPGESSASFIFREVAENETAIRTRMSLDA